MSVICVDGRGVARLAVSAARCQALIEAATPPDDVSPHIPVAPARGPVISEVPREVEMTENGPRVRRGAAVGFNRVRIGDAFDVMEEQGRRAHRGKEAFVPPFTSGQIQAGRDYATLVERLDASGLKCSSLESVGGGGGGLTVSEAVGRDMQRLAALRRRIGDGLAKDNLRPSKGGARSAIRVRDLVDQVCCGGRTLAQVLEHHGWGEKNMRVRGLLREALAAALDRMQGYDLVDLDKVS